MSISPSLGFTKARAGFAEAKAGVEDLARGIERADRNAVKLRADLAAAKTASDQAQAARTAARPGRADAADAALFAQKQAAHAEATRLHGEAVARENAVRAALTAAEVERGAMTKRLSPAQAEASRAAAALDREKSAVMGLKREIEELSGGTMTSLSGVEGRIKSQAEGVAVALEHQAAAARHAAAAGRDVVAGNAHEIAAERAAHRIEHGQEHHGFKNYALQTAAMAVSAHAIVEGIETTMEHGAEYQHKLVALRNAGRTPEEIEEMNAASHAALRGAPTATLTGNLEILNETVGAFGSVEHAIEHLGFMNKAAATLHAVAGDKIGGSAGEMGNQFARFFEMRGTAGNGEVFEHEAAQMMKSMMFTGGNVNPRELLNFAQQAKSSLQNYDLRFLSRIAPSLIGEVGGDRAGTQANAFNSVILGKANDKKQAEAWIKYGLIDKAQMTKKGDAFTGWNGGAIYHTDEALKDPLEFGEKYILPALEKKGVNINDPLALTKVLGTLFRNVNSAAFANELWQKQNRQRLHKDEDLIGRVEDPEVVYQRLLKTDPTVAMGALKGALGSFLTALSGPMMEPAARNLSGMASTLNDLAIAAHDHPAAATVAGLTAAAGSLYAAGKLSYGLLNGFGNATFGPAAGEMVAAGHEQLAAGRIMMTAAEAMRLGAVGHDLPGVMPGGKVAGAAERAVVREGEHLAEGAAEAAIGQKIIGAVEGGLKGGLTVGALEVAATAGVTLTAGSVALVGLTAAAIIAGIKSTMDPKHQAASEPGFGNPFAPAAPIDFADPKYRDPDGMTDEEKREAAKPWWNRGKGTPRGRVQSQRDTDRPGRWVPDGRGGMKWALEDRDAMLKHAPFFSTAPLGVDGLPTVPMPTGMLADPYDKRTWAHIGANVPAPQHGLYEPADVPLPPVVPPRPAGTPVEEPATPLPRDAARYPVVPEPMALHDLGTATPSAPIPVHVVSAAALPAAPSAPVPVHVVSTAANMPLSPMGPGMHRDFTLGNGTGGFGSPGMGVGGGFQPFPGHRAPSFTPEPAHAVSPDIAPHVDLSALDGVAGRAGEAKTALEAVGAVDISPKGSMAYLDALIAKANAAKAALAGIGSGGGSGTTGSTGPSRVVADPGVGKSR